MARTKAFNPEEKLTVAMMQFWQHGYDGTSLQDLVDAMGINRFSIYNTFGDKEALFFKSLKHYTTQIFEPLTKPLLSDGPGMQRIQQYFLNLSTILAAGIIKSGCFMQNAVQEASVTNPEVGPYVASVFDRLRQGFINALQDAEKAGELTVVLDAEAAAEFLLMQVQALIVSQRQVSPEQLQANTAFLLEDIARW